MNREDINSITSQWISIWNSPANWEMFEKLHLDSFEDMSPAGRKTDKEAFAKALSDMLRAFPDMRTTADDIVIDEKNGKAAVRWTSTGINKEQYLGIGPTYRKTKITGIEIIEINDYKIIRRWGEWDISDHHI